jgi:hypothetical protein
MKVVALKPGFLGKLRQPGDEFDVPEGYAASWFTPAGELDPEAAAEKPKQRQRQRGGPLADLV